MKYLLDTCTISDFVKGHKKTQHHIKTHEPCMFAISTITVTEIHYGLARNPKLALKIKPILQSMFNVISILDFDAEAAMQAATLRAYLHQKGMPIGSYDLLIAATAMAHDLIVITSNEKEFQRVPNIRIENWRE